MFRGFVLLLGLVNISLQVHFPELVKDKRASWGYTQVDGPNTWAENFPEFCAGIGQSPIDYNSSTVKIASPDPGPIQMVGYDMMLKGQLTNNGHSLVYSNTDGVKPYITGGRLGNDRYEFLQLHWHWGSDSSKGSEHTVNGKEYPLELHMVHVNTRYGLDNFASYHDGAAVLGFLYEVSTNDNDALTPLLSSIKKMRSLNKLNKKSRKKNRVDTWSVDVPTDISLNSLVPPAGVGDNYYYYSGGLTTPACNEIVQWTSFINTVPVSEAQLEQFRGLTNSDGVTLNDNYRPPQPLNGRTVYMRSATGTTTTTGSTAAAETSAAVAAGTLGGIVLGAGAAFIINAVFGAPQGRVAARTSQSSAGTKISEAEQLLKAANSLFG